MDCRFLSPAGAHLWRRNSNIDKSIWKWTEIRSESHGKEYTFSLRGKRTNQWIWLNWNRRCHETNSLIWNWAGRVARMTDDRWTKVILNWWPPTTGSERWTNGIKIIARSNRQQVAMGRSKRKEFREAYIQQWMHTGWIRRRLCRLFEFKKVNEWLVPVVWVA